MPLTPAGSLDICEPGRIAGWVRLAGDARPAVELWHGARRVGVCVAERLRPDLAAAGMGDGRYGFLFQPTSLTTHDLGAVTVAIGGTGYVFVPGQAGAVARDRHLPSVYRRRHAPDTGVKQFESCVLHIGTEKTGTSTLQSLLSRNRADFARQGVLLPLALTPHADFLNHEYLATLAMDEADEAELRDRRGIGDAAELWALRAAVFDRFDREAGAAPAHCTRLLLSNEHCHSEVTTVRGIARVRALLEPFCERFEIHVYLRPQHELAMSRYGMALMLGQVDKPMFPALSPGEALYFDYAALLERWAGVFGADTLRPHVLDRATLVGGTLTDDFLAALAIDANAMATVADTGGNVSAEAQYLLRRLYATAEGQALPVAARVWISERLREIAPGRGAMPARAEAEAFLGLFAVSNDAVRQRWFSDRARLFTPNLSAYPETVTLSSACDKMLADDFAAIVDNARRHQGRSA